jgi:hypothetical protein
MRGNWNREWARMRNNHLLTLIPKILPPLQHVGPILVNIALSLIDQRHIVMQPASLDSKGSNNSSSLSSSFTFDMFLGGSDHEWQDNSSPATANSSSAHPSPNDTSESSWSDGHSATDANASAPSPTINTDRGGRNTKRSRGSRPVRCSHTGCNRTFSNAYTCGVHARVHGPNKKKRVQCSLCEETFSRRHDMMRHEVIVSLLQPQVSV